MYVLSIKNKNNKLIYNDNILNDSSNKPVIRFYDIDNDLKKELIFVSVTGKNIHDCRYKIKVLEIDKEEIEMLIEDEVDIFNDNFKFSFRLYVDELSDLQNTNFILSFCDESNTNGTYVYNYIYENIDGKLKRDFCEGGYFTYRDQNNEVVNGNRKYKKYLDCDNLKGKDLFSDVLDPRFLKNNLIIDKN
ncbi:MAG: hypothetical protein N4A48_09830 [Tepidibacter sp.]|jgi:hypothetical protein|uniref:hypothetical protein n=1 Tax=Tepidibacter sp. TaxID=2529387 RepID=UPI0025E39C70|nr:hypothetical protein [Tepidibacter sp.]MCT4509039.1 hypothetical protein [Tepidibacter sp.]